MKSLLATFFFTVFICQHTVAQTDDKLPVLNYGNQDFNMFLARNLPFPPQMLKGCLNSKALLALKFKIDVLGNIKYLEITGNISDSLKIIYKDIIMKTSSYWEPRYLNGKPTESNILIQPIVFGFIGCDENCSDTNNFTNEIFSFFDIFKEDELVNILPVSMRFKSIPKKKK